MAAYMGEEEVIQKNMALAQQKIYTVEDIEALPDGLRAELIDGQIFYMATPSRKHQQILMAISAALAFHMKRQGGACKVYPAPFAVYLNRDELTYLEPDISVVCDKSKLEDDGCHGAPDFTAEIISPGSRSRDCLLKLFHYRNAGVREYWLIDPERESVTVYDFAENAVKSFTFRDKVKVNIFPDLEIDFSEMDLS